MRRLALVFLLLLITSSAAAQTGGQFCVRSFEDRNNNGTLDGGEPLLTSGISADLVNADGVIVASALLADAPTAAQGVICFQFLTPGEYSIVVASATYNPTTTNTFSASISEGTLPTVVTYGGQRINAASAATPPGGTSGISSQPDANFLPRVVISLLGALLVMAGMIILGALIYLFIFRSRQPYPSYADTDASTSGTLPPVELEEAPDTDEIEPVT